MTRTTRRMANVVAWALLLMVVLVSTVPVRADIDRWDNGQPVPGGVGVTPGPGIVLSNWNTAGQNLEYANLGYDLTGATFANSDLSYARFPSASAVLTNTVFTNATITGTDFLGMVAHGFTAAQLYSTASYANGNLTGITLSFDTLSGSNALTAWNFANQNLTNASFVDSSMANAVFNNAIITGADFSSAQGLISSQIYSTANYLNKNLTGVGFSGCDLTGWSFAGQNLTNADFSFGAGLTGTNFAGATITGADFLLGGTNGLTADQLYSTASYTSGSLTGVILSSDDLTGWNFANQNLTNAFFHNSTLTNAVFTNAVINGASFTAAIGFTPAQLYSTASYVNGNLSRVDFDSVDLTGWDLSGQNLTSAIFKTARLTNTNLTNAIITGASFNNTTVKGFTAAQLYSTASYVIGNLSAVNFGVDQLTGWNFAGQNLTVANFASATLTNANFNDADLRGAVGWSPGTGTTAINAILPNGTIQSPSLVSGETLKIDFTASTIPVVMQTSAAIAAGGTLSVIGGGQITTPGLANSGAITFAGPGNVAWTGQITGTGSVSLAGGAGLTSDGIVAHSLQLGANSTLAIRPNTGDITVAAGASKVSTLTLTGSMGNWSSLVDVANNALIVEATDFADKESKIATLLDQVNQARGGLANTWTGTGGITSSTVASGDHVSTGGMGLAVADAAELPELVKIGSYDGQPIDNNSIIVVAAHTGDVTLDGRIDIADLNAVTSHWQMTGAIWSEGDTSGGPNGGPDGRVDISDLNAVTSF